jgi:SAM-dependent methyltransferase
VNIFSNEPASVLYNKRYEKFGRDIRTVGWGTSLEQTLRFDVLFRDLNPKGKTILDVGCGLGDLVPYLNHRTNGDFKYIGIDVASALIEDSKTVHGDTDCSFFVGDIFNLELSQVDISVLSGTLTLKRDGIEDYARDTLIKMVKLSREAAALNFLSTYVDFEADYNQHYRPETIFSWAKELDKRVNLIHDYPLYEFTIQIKT